MRLLLTGICLIIYALLCQTLSAQTPASVIKVGTQKTTILIFPADIIDADRGSADIDIRIEPKAPTVLKVKTATPGFRPTNLTVYTDDSRMYNIYVSYDSVGPAQPYRFTPAVSTSTRPLSSSGNRLNQHEIKTLARTLFSDNVTFHHPRASNSMLKIELNNIWIKGDILFFRFSIQNRSLIPYDIDFTRFYIRDNHKAKRTSILETELYPAYTLFEKGPRVEAGQDNALIVAFKKFTIADSKHFAVELFEKDGDRHMQLNIKGIEILQAESLVGD